MTESTPARLLRAAPGLLLLLTAAAYAGVVHLGFVWDDIPLVVDNTLTSHPEALRAAFTADLWSTAGGAETDSGYYRPLILVDLALDRLLWGLSPAGHHLHSLAWHLLAVALLHGLLRRLCSPAAALAGATVFALHPIQSEAVIWVAARNDPMAAALAFGAVLVLLPQGARPWRLALGGLLVLGGMLSKETAILAPALLLGLDLAGKGGPRQALAGWRRHVAAASGVLAWLALRVGSGVGGGGLPTRESLEWVAPLGLPILGHYAGRLLWPFPLTNGHTAEYLGLDAAPHLAALGVAALLAAALLFRGRRLAATGLAFACLAWLPTVLAIAMRGQLGERYLYLPLAGVAVAVAASWPSRPLGLVGLLPAAVLSLLLVHDRVPEWQSDLSLWGAAYEDEPNPYTAVSLGHALNEAGEPRAATLLFHEGLDHELANLYACSVAVSCPLKNDLPELAERGADLSIAARCPPDDRLRGLRAVAFLLAGRVEDARAQIQAAEALEEDARLPLAAAAVALIDGDAARVDELDTALGHPLGFGEQATRLAHRSGRLQP